MSKHINGPGLPDPPEGKVQPDGRVVIGPDLSSEPTRTKRFAQTLVIVPLILCGIVGFFVGRTTAPTVERVPFADRYVGQRVRVSEACGGDIRRYQNAVIPIGKPLKPGDATLIKQELEAQGFQNVSIEGVTYGGDYFYFAQGCL